ncbi:dTMP kinase [candidate division KSB1 bacterium]|nr:dTMP kinase [candidate division KSB1 bacterium]
MRGIFITFEGLDACGKSLQLKKLSQQLSSRGNAVLEIREPGGTSLSERIRQVVLQQSDVPVNRAAEFLLYSAARAQLVSEVIKPALNQGKTVLCDRYYDSSTAYQGYGRGIDSESIDQVNMFATSGLAPDITFLLDITIAEMKNRQRKMNAALDRIESENDDFFSKVRDGYLELAQKHSDRIIVIDGMQTITEITEQIWNYTWSYLQGV